MPRIIKTTKRGVPGALLLALALAIVPTTAWAQPVPSREPSSTHIFPAGGQRGTVVEVFVGGECLPPETSFRLWGEGVAAPDVLGPIVQAGDEPSLRRLPTEVPIAYPKEWDSRIEIAADASLGARLWRLTCARGGTGARPFLVGDLPELIETESNSTPERAEPITLPVTVNGRIAGERDLDYYRFSASEGDVVVCDVVAARLGSPLEAVVELRDAAGRRLPVQELRAGADPIVALRAPVSGEYLLMISHLGVQGGPAHVYRLTVSTAPYRAFAFPPGGRLGESREIEMLTLSGGESFNSLREIVSFDAPGPGPFWRRIVPDGTESVPPSSESALGANNVLLWASDAAEVVESEPNDSAGAATEVELPIAVSGRFQAAVDEDWFVFSAIQAQALAIECRPFPPAAATLPVVELYSAAGSLLASAASADASDRICRLEWMAPADGNYQLRVHDLRHGIRGGPEFIYRLSLIAGRPDFALTLTSDFVNLMPGSRTEVEVQLRRSGGFAGEVECTISDAAALPEGVQVEPARITAGQANGKLVLVAADDAPPGDVALRVVGRATADGAVLERMATARHLGVDAEGISVGAPDVDQLQLTVQHKPVFRLYCAEAYQYAYRGTVYPYLMEVERLNGFEGPITLQLGDRQNRDLDGIEFFEVVVPPGQTQVMLPIYLPETMHINVQSQSQVYAQAFALFDDRWERRQSQLVVSEKRCMLRTLPTLVKLRTGDSQLVAEPGGTLECRLELDRTPNFAGAMQVELLEPESAGFTAEKTTIQAGQTSATATVHIAGNMSAGIEAELRFRAVGELGGGALVVSEATVPVSIRPGGSAP